MNFKEFIDVFFTKDYFLILLIILLLILLVITIQLIKNQYVSKKEVEEETEDTLDNLIIDFMDKEKQEELPRMNEILLPSYEDDEEENAIISGVELERISQSRNINSNSGLINQYEMEQEQKAIISYEELLKNAANLKMNYEDTVVSGEGPLIRKVELETPTLERNLSYIEETNFLVALKEFRSNLK